MSIETEAMTRVEKARVALIVSPKRTFYSVLVTNVVPVISRDVETAGTNGKQHFWNPDFVAELDQDELEGVQAHESEHDARHHSTRRGNRDPLLWNKACDYSINLDLIDEGFKLPKDAYLDERFRGMSAEDIYRILDTEQRQPEPEEGDGQDDGDEGNDQPGDNADTDPGKDDDQAGNDVPDDQAGDDAGEQGNQPGDAGEGTGEGEAEGEGQGSGDAGDAAGEAPAQPGKTSGDCGRCGEVLDAAEDGDSIENIEQDANWERLVRQAASVAKARGNLPGHITREIERANNQPRDWRDELREFAEQGALRIETWNRPNRRFTGRGLILPSTQRDGVNKAVFAIDTSGSMDKVALACVRNEAQALLDDGVIDQVAVVYCDTQVNREDVYSTGDEIEFDPRGGGGTVLQPMFDHIAEQHEDASLIVCFTDGYTDINNDSPEPACPVLWAFTGYPQAVREMIASAPWGAKGIDVGAH